MTQIIKLIWDFRGPNATLTAKHHVIHLNEYISIEQLELNETGIEEISEFRCFAYMLIQDHELEKVKSDLKPHKGSVYKKSDQI